MGQRGAITVWFGETPGPRWWIYGNTAYTNGNDFQFVAVGATSPALWHDLAIYLIGMTQSTNNVQFDLKSPGLGPGPTPVAGHGADDALFSKIALPLGHGVSAGLLLSYETSHFDASSVAAPDNTVRYQTYWRPSGGFGVAWQPNTRLLFGFRALLNNDLERRKDATGTVEGLARSAELRLGGYVSPWEGALIDVLRFARNRSLAPDESPGVSSTARAARLDRHTPRRCPCRCGSGLNSPTTALWLIEFWGAHCVTPPPEPDRSSVSA